MVKKEARRVIVFVENYKIEGYAYLIPGARIVDELNKSTQFFVLTDCIIYDKDTSLEIDKVNFMVINKNRVSIVFPVDEM